MSVRIRLGDATTRLRDMADGSVRCCVTSPPYFGLRDYNHADQLGSEATPEAYVEAMVKVFSEVRRVLANDGTLWLNIGDSYSRAGGRNPHTDPGGVGNNTNTALVQPASKGVPGVKPKNLVGIPWRLAFALQADGWYLRQDIIWHKPNPVPEPTKDRCTKAHEYLFLLSKQPRYFFNPIIEPAVDGQGTRTRRSVWSVPVTSCDGAHFAVFPPALIEPCILAGSVPGDTVLDPFMGSGTTGVVALQHGRKFAGIELNAKYVAMARARIAASQAKAAVR